MAKAFYIIIETGPDAGRRFDLRGGSIVIGRDPTNDIVLDDIEVSRKHARLIAQSGGYVIEDMGSTNGTYVDEERIRAMLPLRPGTRVRLGENITFMYEAEVVEEADTDPVLPASPQRRGAAPAASQPEPLVSEARLEPDPYREAFAEADPEPQPRGAMEAPAAEMPAPRRERRSRPAILENRWAVGCLILLLLGACGAIAFLWYVDANFLWCDVFGGLIPACR